MPSAALLLSAWQQALEASGCYFTGDVGLLAGFHGYLHGRANKLSRLVDKTPWRKI